MCGDVVVLYMYCLLLAVETGGIMITPRPAPPGVDLKPAFPMIPFFGVQPCLMDAEVPAAVGPTGVPGHQAAAVRATHLSCILPSPGPGD